VVLEGSWSERYQALILEKLTAEDVKVLLSLIQENEGLLVEADHDLAQLLAALRNWQVDGLNEDLAEAFAGHFEEHEPLSDDEVDWLCERLYVAGEQVVKGAAY
jgi:hypothetical protein